MFGLENLETFDIILIGLVVLLLVFIYNDVRLLGSVSLREKFDDVAATGTETIATATPVVARTDAIATVPPVVESEIDSAVSDAVEKVVLEVLSRGDNLEWDLVARQVGIVVEKVVRDVGAAHKNISKEVLAQRVGQQVSRALRGTLRELDQTITALNNEAREEQQIPGDESAVIDESEYIDEPIDINDIESSTDIGALTTTSPIVPPATVATAVQGSVNVDSISNCNAPNLIDAAKDFYDTQGQWQGIYTMSPIGAETSNSGNNNTQCDVKYTYNAVSGSGSGTDYRRFSYEKQNGDWVVTRMGSYHSGPRAQDL